MFIDRYVWVVGDLSEEELKIAKKGPQDQTYAPIIAFMAVFGILGITARIFAHELGVAMLVIWAGCAVVLGCYVAITVRQCRRYVRVMNGRMVYDIEENDPFDRLMFAVDDRDLLDRHSIMIDVLFDRARTWEAWANLCEHPDLSEEEKGQLNELINSSVRAIARMMRELEPAAAR